MRVTRIPALAASAALLIAGCSTQAKRVDCDGTLQPINRAAPPTALPVTPNEAPMSGGRPRDEK